MDGSPIPPEPLATWVRRNQYVLPSRCDTVGLFDPTQSTLTIRDPDSGQTAQSLHWSGLSRAQLISGDWTGRGREGPGFFLPESSEFLLFQDYLAESESCRFVFGQPEAGWIPLSGDWDGDGVDGVGLFHPVQHTLRILNPPWMGVAGHQYILRDSLDTAIPVSGDPLGRGRDSLGLFDGETQKFHIREALTIEPPDCFIQLSDVKAMGALPLLGDWLGLGFDSLAIYLPLNAEFQIFFGATLQKRFSFGEVGQALVPVRLPWPLV